MDPLGSLVPPRVLKPPMGSRVPGEAWGSPFGPCGPEGSQTSHGNVMLECLVGWGMLNLESNKTCEVAPGELHQREPPNSVT